MFDITSMIGGGSNGNSGSSTGGFDFANYAAIKNGSYGKLVKSYYGGTTKSVEEAKTASLNSKKTDNAKAKLKEETAGSEAALIKKDADELKASAQALDSDDLWKKTDGKLDMTKVTSAVKSFADDYNKVIDRAGKSSSKEVTQDATNMVQLGITFGKLLTRVGLNIGEDGKFTVNEDKLKKADEATLKSLFDGFGSYGSQIADKAGSIIRDADRSSAIYGSDATTTSSALSGLYNQLI